MRAEIVRKRTAPSGSAGMRGDEVPPACGQLSASWQVRIMMPAMNVLISFRRGSGVMRAQRRSIDRRAESLSTLAPLIK